MSSFANDAAWALLSGDRIEKLVPLLIGGAFAGMGAMTGAGFRIMNPETGEFDPGFHDAAMIQDPITGGMIAETSTDSLGVDSSSTGGRVLGGATGALQGLNPFSYLGAAGRGVQVAGKGVRNADRFADTVRTVDGITDVTRGPLRGAGQAFGGGIEASGRGMSRLAGGKNISRLGRAAQFTGNVEEHLGPQTAALGAFGLRNLFGTDPTDTGGDPNQMSGGTTGFGTGFGGAGGGVNDISNVQGNALGDKQIWNPGGYSGNKQVQQFENQGEFGGFGTAQKGETMFVNNKGNEIKKEVIKLMYKEKCPKCDKASCTCDDEKKAVCSSCGKMQKMCGCEKKAEKKPAHGMVIVIGSKAGPGPSKDGKREKLDSEKKEK